MPKASRWGSTPRQAAGNADSLQRKMMSAAVPRRTIRRSGESPAGNAAESSKAALSKSAR